MDEKWTLKWMLLLNCLFDKEGITNYGGVRAVVDLFVGLYLDEPIAGGVDVYDFVLEKDVEGHYEHLLNILFGFPEAPKDNGW